MKAGRREDLVPVNHCSFWRPHPPRLGRMLHDLRGPSQLLLNPVLPFVLPAEDDQIIAAVAQVGAFVQLHKALGA